ncbi:MAG: nucleoside deaminase [Bifidobacteriaceae bacterium]|jgi:tRNA(adenine34) deaminase|nr:nucleoside deaminase [Bifidobacteriaceae bacterium]
MKRLVLSLQEFCQNNESEEIPVAAMIVDPSNSQIISLQYNTVQRDLDVTGHAEINAIKSACKNLGAKYLTDYVLYTSLEPCKMCASVIVAARINKVIFGAYDPKAGAAGSMWDDLRDPRNDWQIKEVVGGVEAEAFENILGDFFKKLRL